MGIKLKHSGGLLVWSRWPGRSAENLGCYGIYIGTMAATKLVWGSRKNRGKATMTVFFLTPGLPRKNSLGRKARGLSVGLFPDCGGGLDDRQ